MLLEHCANLTRNKNTNHQFCKRFTRSERDRLRQTIHLPLITTMLTDLITKVGDEIPGVCFKLGDISNHRGSVISPCGNHSIRRHHLVIAATRSKEIDFGQLNDLA